MLKLDAHFERLLQGVLSLDPRPAYKKNEKESTGGLYLSGMNVKYHITQDRVTVIDVEPL